MKKSVSIFYMAAALIGLIAFFLPWIGSFFGSFSGSDIESIGQQFNFEYAWLLYLFPISFLISSFSKLKWAHAIPAGLIKTIELIPILLLLLLMVKLFIEAESGNTPPGFIEDLFGSIRIGLYLTVLSSIIIIFSPLNKRL
jgi:hypothetical protein